MQHTLRYVVSADPQDRSDYFKALLQVSDLEDLRTAISEAKPSTEILPSSSLAKLNACAAIEAFKSALQPLQCTLPTSEELDRGLSQALLAILGKADSLPDTLGERLVLAKQRLRNRREATFPLQGFDMSGLPAGTDGRHSAGKERRFTAPSWEEPTESTWKALKELAGLAVSVDKEAARLSSLFHAVLEVPSISTATGAVDCPVCESPDALAPYRVEAIRQKLEATHDFRRAQQRVRAALQSLNAFAGQAERNVRRARPTFMSWSEAEKAERSFTDSTMTALLGTTAEHLIAPWRESIGDVRRDIVELGNGAKALRDAVASADVDAFSAAVTNSLKTRADELSAAAEAAVKALRTYAHHEQPLVAALRVEIDKQSDTEGWQTLLDLIDDRASLFDALVEHHVRANVADEIDTAVREIDEAKGRVLDDKFVALSDDIMRWWKLLRPDEPTTFAGVKRAGSGRRFLDLKAGLSPRAADSSRTVLRNAVAVFSDSQLNCLGLSAFLARAVRERTGFVILDDPVPASDEEHRAMFIHRVLCGLVDDGYQVILLTHDQTTWKDIQARYEHLDLDTFVITLDDPSMGCLIKNTSDTLDALIARAKPYIANADPEIRKEYGAKRLREAAERLCSLILVSDRQSHGDSTASLSDYAGKSLGALQKLVDPLLIKSPEDHGKLRTIARHLNPGSHDESVPSPGELKVCCGDIEALRRAYL